TRRSSDLTLQHADCTLHPLPTSLRSILFFARKPREVIATTKQRKVTNETGWLRKLRYCRPFPLLPLDCSRRLGCHIVDDAVDAFHLVDDAGGGSTKEVHVVVVEVGRHAVDGGHGAQRADELIGAAVAHHA